MKLVLVYVLVFELGAERVPLATFDGANALGDCIANAQAIGKTETFRGWRAACLPVERGR